MPRGSRRGRLVQAATYGGFGPLATPTAADRRAAEAERDRSSDLLAALAASVETRGKRSTPPAVQERARQQALRELTEAKNSWDAAAHAADEAAADAERASARVEALAAEIEKIRGRLREAESAERDARTEARAARKRAMQLRQSAAAAEQRVSTARTVLKTLEA
jgi:chromosome segregation ATPase